MLSDLPPPQLHAQPERTLPLLSPSGKAKRNDANASLHAKHWAVCGRKGGNGICSTRTWTRRIMEENSRGIPLFSCSPVPAL